MSKLKVAMMSSYDECCGIAAYTDRLITGLRATCDITLLKNKPYRKVSLRHYEDVKEVECFEVTIWTNNIYFDDAKALAAVQDADILHIQFESALYHQSWMLPFLAAVRGLGIPVVVTAHSSCIWPTLHNRVDKWIAHSSTLAQQLNATWVHMPILFYPFRELDSSKKIVSFGLGRNQDDMVLKALEAIRLENPGVKFEPHYAHHKWVPEVELVDYLLSGRAITLLYPPTGALVNSSAAAFALGLSRPLIITGTSWFSTVMETFNGVHGVYVANSPEAVATAIKKCLSKSNYELRSEYEARKTTAAAAKMGMEQVVDEHLGIYKGLLK